MTAIERLRMYDLCAFYRDSHQFNAEVDIDQVLALFPPAKGGLPDDLRAAAERVERFTRIASQGTPSQAPAYRDAAWSEVYCGTPHTQLSDMRTLALHAIASILVPADDGEPVDAAWWRSVGLIDPEHYVDHNPNNADFAAFEMSEDRPFGVMNNGDGAGWWACYLTADGFDGSERHLCPLQTKGHARRFFAAIGHPLVEPAKT